MRIRQNVNKYINLNLDYKFVKNNEFNSDIAYLASTINVCNKLLNVIDHIKKYQPNYSKFGIHCISKFVSYNQAKKLYNKKYIIDYSNAKDHRGFSSSNIYYEFKNITWSNNVDFSDVKERFLVYEYNHYEYSEDTLNIDFDASLLNKEIYAPENYFMYDKNHGYIFGPNIYMVLQWFIKNDKLTIIDQGNYIMFYFNDNKKFHLERTKDNDVYFREEDFDYAIELIFKKLL